MPVTDWVIPELLPAEPMWAWKQEHCPATTELNQCVGKLVMYAYLRVDEERDTILSTILPFVDSDQYEWKILPIKFDLTFKVICVGLLGQAFGGGGAQAGQAFAIEHCSSGYPRRGASPQHIGETQFHFGAPVAVSNPEPPEANGPTIHAKSTFNWQQGIVIASFPAGTGGTAHVPGLGDFTLGASGGQVTFGPSYSLEIDWTLRWDSGFCTFTPSIPNTTSFDDAKAVFDAGKIVREL